jgi:hypothetical protein
MQKAKVFLVVCLVTLFLELAGCDLFSGGGSSGGGGTAPAVPSGLTAGSPTPITISVSWSAAAGATSYQLYRDTTSGGAFNTQVYTGSSTSCLDVVPSPGASYYYKVRASNSTGSSSLSSAVSSQAIGTISWALISGSNCYMTNDVARYTTNNLFTITGSTLSLGGTLTTKVNKYSGWTDGDIGVLFACTDLNNYWKFVIFPAGGYGIFYKSGGTLYTQKTYTATTFVKGTGQDNILSVHYYYSSNYYLDFSINGNLQYSCYSGSPIISGGVTGFIAQVGNASQESFPSYPVWDTFSQTSPIAF